MRPVFIGDETTAAGYRLAGFDVRTPAPQEARRALHEARAEQPPLVLVTMELARQLPDAELLEALSALAPPVLPVSDAGGRVPAIDLAGWIRGGIVA